MEKENAVLLFTYFRRGEFNKISEYIHLCPATNDKQFSLERIDSRNPVFVIEGIESLASLYYFTRKYDYAFTFAMATYYCAQSYLGSASAVKKEDVLYYAGSSAFYILKCYLDTAAYQQGVQFYTLLQGDYEEFLHKSGFLSARLIAVELYLANWAPEDARKLFEGISVTELESYQLPLYNRVAENLRRLFTDISVLTGEFSLTKATRLKEDLQATINSIQSSIDRDGQMSEKEGNSLKQLQEYLKQLQDCEEEEQLNRLCDSITENISIAISSIGGYSEEDDLTSMRIRAKKLADVLWEEDAGEDLLQNSLDQLITMLPFFETAGKKEENLQLWFIARFQSYLGYHENAISNLEKIRSNLQELSLAISSKTEKGGVFDQFPQLFPMLVQNYYLSKNLPGTLTAMEASKGRFLREETEMDFTETYEYDSLANELSLVLAKENVHFLSFFVDADYTVSVLATANGKYYGIGLSVNRKTISKWVTQNLQSPENWNQKQLGLFAPKKSKILSEELEELLPVIGLALEEGNLNEGDHIVYSQDEELVLFPLHYARFKGKYLIENFSLSRVHNAFQLISLLKKEDSEPRQIVCFSVPSVQDEENEQKLRAFEGVQLWLKENVPMPVYVADAEIGSISQRFMKKSIIHFATHGVFPGLEFPEFEKNNPFHNSGLLLKANGKQPHLDIHFDYYQKEYLLSPKKLLELEKSLEGCHISFQACVSGRSKEGIAGDAIGMEWAAFYCGATSMLSAAWDIDVFWVNEFCISFYDYWLNKKKSKATAYAETMRNLIKRSNLNDKPDVYYWGGMILSGNWK